ncbi:MAG: class I SAM-dependent methyltransferase [Bacteroidales bacterium]|nr:class I SAM-dependent methyltransferase [Bacteroidales bacterium]
MSKTYFYTRIFCPVCGSSDNKELYNNRFLSSPIKEYLQSFYSSQGMIETEYLTDVNFILKECGICKTIYQKYIPNDFLMNKLYDEWIDPQKVFELHKKKDDLEYHLRYAQEIAQIIAYLNKTPSDLSFLDFGMGWGKWCHMAESFGCNVFGTELSEHRIDFAKSRGLKVISLDEISNYRFDFINTEQVFEHIPKPLETLVFLKGFLKARGILKISVPNGSLIKRKLKIDDWTAPKGSNKSLNPVSPLEHINCFNNTSIIKMADLAELKQVKIPLSIQFTICLNRTNLKQMLHNIIKPLYYNYSNKNTYLFFTHKNNLE